MEALNRLAIDRKTIDRVPKLAGRGNQKRRVRNVCRGIRERTVRLRRTLERRLLCEKVAATNYAEPCQTD